jgi:hypothetical protein
MPPPEDDEVALNETAHHSTTLGSTFQGAGIQPHLRDANEAPHLWILAPVHARQWRRSTLFLGEFSTRQIKYLIDPSERFNYEVSLTTY